MSYCYTIRKREKSERYCGPTSWSRSLQERYSLLVSDAKESRGWYLKDHGANPMAKNLSQNKAKKMISTPTNSIPRFRARNHVGIYLLAKEQRPDFPFTTRSPFWGIIEAGRTKRNTWGNYIWTIKTIACCTVNDAMTYLQSRLPTLPWWRHCPPWHPLGYRSSFPKFRHDRAQNWWVREWWCNHCLWQDSRVWKNFRAL